MSKNDNTIWEGYNILFNNALFNKQYFVISVYKDRSLGYKAMY